jgi:hypothetical protein
MRSLQNLALDICLTLPSVNSWRMQWMLLSCRRTPAWRTLRAAFTRASRSYWGSSRYAAPSYVRSTAIKGTHFYFIKRCKPAKDPGVPRCLCASNGLMSSGLRNESLIILGRKEWSPGTVDYAIAMRKHILPFEAPSQSTSWTRDYAATVAEASDFPRLPSL